MKRLGLFAAIMLSLGVLTGCAEQPVKPSAEIRPAAFSEETQEVLELLEGSEEQILFFDYETDETVRSYALQVWVHADHAWQCIGSSSRPVGGARAPGGRLGIRLTEDGYQLFNLHENGHSIYTSDAVLPQFGEELLTGMTSLQDPTAIVPEEEIVLFVKVGTDENRLSLSGMEDFRAVDCTAGMAVTITFSAQELEGENPDAAPVLE